MPDRADRVDHVAGRQRVASRDLGVTRGAAAERAALLEQLWAGATVDRAVDPTTAKQRAIRGIDDGIDIKRRNVSDDDLERGIADRPRGDRRHFAAASGAAIAAKSLQAFAAST